MLELDRPTTRPSRGAPARGAATLGIATLGAAVLLATLAGAPRALAGELEDLRVEVETLRSRLAAVLEGCAPRPPGEPPAPPDAASEVLQVRTRATLAVARDPATGDSVLATPWLRTSVAAIVPRREWIQLHARRKADGSAPEVSVALARHGGSGSANVASGRIEADGRVFELPVETYEVSRDEPAAAARGPGLRRESVRLALPPAALEAVAGARQARFVAGASAFDLTDEHVLAFAALAARLADGARPPAASASPPPD